MPSTPTSRSACSNGRFTPGRTRLSLEQVAREVGISPSYMAMIERGEREASEAILFALERVLGKATGA